MSKRSAIAAAILFWSSPGPALAANVLQTFFVPLPEDDMQISLKAVDNFAGNVGEVMESVIGMAAGTDGTVIYYDHWEDGYEADITNPTQLTSQVWGDGNPDNGYPPGFPGDLLNAGDVVKLEDQIDVTRNSVTIEYDGRDKVSVTQPIAMTRAMYPVDPGEVTSESIDVRDIGTHGTEYRAPVGEGTGTGANTNELFSTSALYVMADYDFTRIEIDADNDGAFEDVVYLDQGEPYFVNGGVLAGATVRGNQPFQCTLVTGDVGSNYETRWFELWPTTQWDSEYISPLATRTNAAGELYTSHVFLYNPNAAAITVTVATAASTSAVVVAANSVGTPVQMPLNGAARFFTADGSRFLGVDVFETTGACQAYDWGLSLMPVKMMSTAGLVGWGPGYGTTGTGANGNPIWITAISNTTLYVDYDGDPATGALTDPQGNHCDVATNVAALQVTYYVDSDDDQSGLRYYTVDGTLLIGAWGEDPARADTGNPYLDMGYAIPAFPTVLSKKYATLLLDNNANGYPDAGDTLEYTIDVINVGFATANHVTFEDEPPTNLTVYLTNSAYVAGSPISDSLPPKLTRFPFDEGGYNVGTIALGATTTVRYVAQIVDSLPADFTGYIHNNATIGGTNGNWTTGSSTNVLVGGLAISKQASTTNLLEPGTNFTYTVSVVNTGLLTYTGVRIADALPLGLTYVSNSAHLALSGLRTNTVFDRFDERAFAGDNGTIPWSGAWAEGGEADGVAAGGVQVLAHNVGTTLEAYALRIANASRSATRAADLSGHTNAVLSFSFFRDALDDANDAVSVFVSTNNWTSSNLLVRLQGAATDAAYVSTNFNVNAYVSTNTAVRFLSTATLGAADYVWFDDVKFTLAGTDPTFPANPPPILAENLTLAPGSTATVTLAVTVDSPPVATQVVNAATVRADQHLVPIPSNPATNRINATSGIALLKTSSTTNMLPAGTGVVYTILISNTGTVAQTGIDLQDVLPAGMTYSNGSAQLYRPFAHTNEFLDEFDLQVYTNSDGNVAWSGSWTETGDDGSATAGNVALAVDNTSIPGQTYALRTALTPSIQRAANLAGYTNVTLWFDYRRVNLEADDFVNVGVSSNGGGAFTQVGQIGGATNDGSYFAASFDISAYASTGTVIRFAGTVNRAADDYVWLDNVRIAAGAANATSALPAPPDLLDGYVLPPGTNMTVTLAALVDNPISATNFVNVARLISDQQTTWLTSRVTNAAVGYPGMKISKTSALTNNWDFGLTNDYYVTIENTGTVALTGLKLADALPAGVSFVSNSAQIVRFYSAIATNGFTNTVSDLFGAATYANNDGSTNWLGDWAEAGDDGNPAAGNVLIQGGGLAFTNGTADNDYATRTNPLAPREFRAYTNVTLSFAYRRLNWDAGDTFTLQLSTNDFGAQTQIFAVPTTAGSDAAYVAVTTNLTFLMASQMALRLLAGGGFNAGDSLQVDFATFTNQGYDLAYTWQTNYSTNWNVYVASNLTATATNLLANYSLAPGSNVTVRLRGTLNMPLAATQFVNTATATNNQTAPASATATNFSVANRVGDFIWFDVDGNGVQNGGETGLTGVVVRLYSAASNLLLTTTSGVAGAYAFTNLPTGNYFLQFATPTNYLATAQDQGGDDALDSDVSTNTGRTATFALGGGTNDVSRDAGFYSPPSTIGDFVWRDVNGDGLQSGGAETGLVGVVVTLYDAASNVVGVTTSTAAGAYVFTNLPTGNYFLQFAAPSNFTITLPDQGGNDAVDSDASPTTGRTAVFHLPPGTSDTSRDAGFSAAVYGLTLTKTSSAGSCLAPGATNTYTIVVANTGTVSQSGIAVEDMLPPGATYMAGSVAATFYSPTGGVVSATYNSSAVFTNPAGITSVTVQAWGGGGGGASRTSNGGGGGGGGGAYSRAAVAVLSGSNYVVTVGGGGAANTAGGDSWFSLGSTTGALARGGSGGVNNNANGAAGGSDATGIGDVLYAGGNGANGVAGSYGGGGGSSAGTNATGVNAVNATGATAPAGGGNGGNGKTAPQGGGSAGSAPGGGGGGALRTANNQTGGAGADGRIVVSYDTSKAMSGSFGAPPNLWTGGTLGTGATVTITFQAVVDVPSAITQAVNTASVYSAVQPVRNASVTNCIQYADVAVTKFVTTNAPDPAQIIDYRVVVTNNGPDASAGLVLTDVLPAAVQYNSHSNGTYNPILGTWTVGALAAYASTTLYVNVTVHENTGGVSATNTAAITGRDVHDPNPSNDTSSVVIVPKGGAVVGDRVWLDADLDGIQDSEETNRIAGIPVDLMDADSNVVASTATAGDGTYLFENVEPGSYYVRFDLNFVINWAWITTSKAGGDDAVDSDATRIDMENYAWTEIIALSGGQTNRNVDVGIRPQKATRAEVAEIWGEWTEGEGRVAWLTSSEWNTAGFNLYRVDPETGAETRLNETLVSSAFGAGGASYAWTDPAAIESGAGTYRLEELELSGGALDLGTHEVVFAAARPRAKAAKATLAPALLAVSELAGPSPVLKMLVRNEGLYGVSLQAVADGMGIALDAARALAERGALEISEQGAAVPSIYDAAGGRLLFHGRGTRNWYARDNAYLVSEGAGLAMPRRDPGAASGDDTFPTTVRFEQDRYPFDSAMVKPADFYYWEYVLSGTNAAATKTFPLDLSGASGDVALKVRLMGWSSTTNAPDHLAEFRFNGVVVGSAAFDGQDVVEAVLSIPAAAVSNGVNVLSVKGVLQPGRSYSYFVVDWIEALFARKLVPLSGTAHFEAGGAGSVSAAAFADPLAVALDGDGHPTWIADEDGALPAKSWTAVSANERYAVAEAGSIPMLAPEAVAAAPWFLAETNRIDYLVLTSRALAPAAQELADYRASQGLRVGVATFEDACDWMAGGVRTPEAIPVLLAYAAETWTEAPWMVVLAGNGHYDYLNALSNEVNHVPPIMVQTADGLFSSDGRLADVDGDGLPDVALGRLPALTAADLAAMVAKIKAYELGFGQAWQNQVVLAADTNDPAAGDFQAATARLAARTGASHPLADTIDLNALAINPARTKLTNWFKAGAGFIHYTGHGGVANWSGKNLLKATDVAAMANASRPPAVVALSCLVGRYEAPGVNSLGELLLRKAGGGAVAAWGPSGLSRNDPASLLGEAFYRAVLQQGVGTLGLAILQARRGLPENAFTADTLAVYNLLGDPALRIAGNTAEQASDANFARWRWQRFGPQALTNASGSGATAAQFFDYAMGGGYDVRAELPEFGFPLPSARETGFVLRWKRRVKRADVEYKLFLSDDLATWESDSPDLQEVGAEPDFDGAMETVRTRVARPQAERTYIGIKAIRK